MATVTISQGKLRGGKSRTESGFEYYEFMGIPYAKPPVGDLRFKSPQQPEPWQNERDAKTIDPNNVASQVNFITGEICGSEDCLYLNVYTPKLPATNTELLPVMVYIHGGGFIFGSGIMKSECGPDYLVENNVILVTINYRLAIFGFLSLDIPEAAGNMGLKDQVKALEWVQNNITVFGGDKNNVTIFGISAGSASIEYLILSPLANGLFHKAILQSGSALNDWAINLEPKKLLMSLLKLLGYKDSMDDTRCIYQYLLTIPTSTLTGFVFKTIETFTSSRLYFGFVPTIEMDFGNGDAFLTTTPYRLLKEGKINKVPIIRGFCGKEGLLMNMMKPGAVKELIDQKQFTSHWSFELEEANEYNKRLLDAYTNDLKPDDELDKSAVEFYGDLHFSAGIWIAAKMMCKEVPIQMYQFSYDGRLNAFKSIYGIMKKGAAHGDDTTYLLRLDVVNQDNIDEADKLLRSKMTKMWTNFARSSEPISNDCELASVEWPKFSIASPAYLNIGEELIVESNYEPKKLAIFEEIYEKYGK